MKSKAVRMVSAKRPFLSGKAANPTLAGRPDPLAGELS